MRLVEPTIEFKRSYIRKFGILKKEDPKYISRFDDAVANFEQVIMDLNNAKHTKKHKDDVFYTILWLVEGDEFIGRLSLRHELNDFLHKFAGHIGYFISPKYRHKGYGKLILELGLEFAGDKGFEKVLLTCDDDNIGSRKIIESNGGIYENKIFDERVDKYKLRYWIEI